MAERAHRMGQSILRNVSSNWAGVAVGIAVSFVLAPLTVRVLGNVYYGIWTLLMQFTGYLWLFDFGVRESVVKYVAQYHASDEHEALADTVRTAVSIYSVVALLALAAVGAVAILLPYLFNIPSGTVTTARVVALLAGATIAQGFVFNVFVGVLMGLQKFYIIARLGIGFGLARAAILYALLTAGYGIVALALVQLAVSIVSNLLVYWCAIRDLPYLSLRLTRPRRATASRLLHYGKYVFITNLGDKLVFATDSIVIGMFLPISALTYYAIGGSLVEYLRSFIASMGALLNPLSSSLEARNEGNALASVFLGGAKTAVLIGLPVCIGFVLLGGRFVSLWMGESYGETAGLVLGVLACGHVLVLPYYSISGVLYGLGRHPILAASRICEGIANLVLSVVLVRHYGLIGVALGTVIPQIVLMMAVLPPFTARLLGVGLRDYYNATYLRPFVASIPFCLACWTINRIVQPQTLLAFFCSLALALPLYGVAAWFMAVSPHERMRVSNAVRRSLRRPVAMTLPEPG